MNQEPKMDASAQPPKGDSTTDDTAAVQQHMDRLTPDAPELPPLLAEFDSMWDYLVELATAKETDIASMIVLGARRKAFKEKLTALAARQPEPVAQRLIDRIEALEKELAYVDRAEVDRLHKAEIINADAVLSRDDRIAELEAALAQPPADLKDAQRLDFLESLLNRTEFQNSKRPAEPVSADMHFHGDAGCSLYIRDLFGNVVRCGSAGTVRSTIDSAMLSSAPTGEKP